MPCESENGIGQLLSMGLRKFGARPVQYGLINNIMDATIAIRQTKPHTIVGIPSQIRLLSVLVPELCPANVLLSADYVSLAVRETIARVWECEVFVHYGLTETGYGCAVDCQAQCGQHIRHDELLVEIIQADGNKPVSNGDWGEIVISTLRREGMPLVRYRTGDMGRLLRGKCQCGSMLPRLDHVKGRFSELRQKINAYEIDELLFGVEEVLDYTATYIKGELRVSINTMYERASGGIVNECTMLLEKKWPGMPVEVTLSKGDTTATGWVTKRGIARY
jgi:phenylacetate-coenzyme A ligase PaaK-like adenylate-forming protein